MSTPEPTLSHLRRHDHLAREGQRQEFLYRVVEGWACAYRALGDGRRQITALYLPGEYCDPQWVLRDRASQPIVALTDLKLSRMALAEIRESRQQAGPGPLPGMQTVTAAVLEQLDRQTEWIVSLGRKTGPERVSAFICELIDRLFETGKMPEKGFNLPLTQIDIADIVGMTPIHVNRILKSLRSEGLVEWKDRWLRVPDMAKLRAFASGTTAAPNDGLREPRPGRTPPGRMSWGTGTSH